MEEGGNKLTDGPLQRNLSRMPHNKMYHNNVCNTLENESRLPFNDNVLCINLSGGKSWNCTKCFN